MEKESKHKRRADKVLPGGGKSLFSDDSSLFFAFSLILTALTCLLLPMKNVVMLRWYDEMSFFAPDLLPAMMHRPGGLLDYVLSMARFHDDACPLDFVVVCCVPRI